MPSILLVSEQSIIRIGLRTILEASSDLTVVGAVADGASAMRRMQPMLQPPDVVIFGYDRCDETLLSWVRTVARLTPSPAVLLICGEWTADAVLRAMRAGACACLPNSAEGGTVGQYVRTIAEGGVVLPAPMGRRLLRRLVPRVDFSRLDGLTERERAVLTLLARGRSNQEIASELIISESTVKKHITRVLHKIGLRTRLEAGLFAHQAGLGTVGPSPVHQGGIDSPPSANDDPSAYA